MLLTISEITVLPGRRQTKPEQVQELSRSISEIGLLNPITIDKEHTLIAGLNRLEAVKLLGWTEIDCTVTSLEGLKAELAEIDENFVRNSVSDMELGEMLLRRKEIYETLHPETKAGIAQAAGMNRAIGNNVAAESAATSKSFVEDTADKLGIAPRTVREHIQTARDMAPETKNILENANIKLTKKAALQLARLEPERQKEAAEMLASKEICTVAEYLSGKQGEPTIPNDSKPEKQVAGTKHKSAETKGSNCTPDGFLAEITSFVQDFHRKIERYNTPYYEAVYPGITPVQADCLRQQMGTISAAIDRLLKNVESKSHT